MPDIDLISPLSRRGVNVLAEAFRYGVRIERTGTDTFFRQRRDAVVARVAGARVREGHHRRAGLLGERARAAARGVVVIFGPYMLKLLLAGDKTQTRRLLAPGRRVYKTGTSHAVQPGRGASGVARIRILSVREQKLGEISEVDAVAEGFASRNHFLLYWADIYHREPDLDVPVQAITFELVK